MSVPPKRLEAPDDRVHDVFSCGIHPLIDPERVVSPVNGEFAARPSAAL